MTENNKETHRELLIDEFLLKTIISLQVTLSTISKDLDQKTDLMHDITDSLTAITYNMKEVKERIDRKETITKEATDLMHSITSKMQLLEAKFENDNALIEGHIKEIKYSVQQLSDSLIELKTQKKMEEATKKSTSKTDLSDLFVKTWEAVKNMRTIFIVILALVLAIGALTGGQGVFMEILKTLKDLL